MNHCPSYKFIGSLCKKPEIEQEVTAVHEELGALLL